jgi:hypothetical protein
MARRGPTRRLDVESEYWRLLLSGVGTVEACHAPGDRPQDRIPVAGRKRRSAAGAAGRGGSMQVLVAAGTAADRHLARTRPKHPGDRSLPRTDLYQCRSHHTDPVFGTYRVGRGCSLVARCLATHGDRIGRGRRLLLSAGSLHQRTTDFARTAVWSHLAHQRTIHRHWRTFLCCRGAVDDRLIAAAIESRLVICLPPTNSGTAWSTDGPDHADL